MPKKSYRVEINEAWCKGCEFCVTFCPKDVLAMDGDVAKVVNPEACIGCELCEMYCPDFAVKVLPDEEGEAETAQPAGSEGGRP